MAGIRTVLAAGKMRERLMVPDAAMEVPGRSPGSSSNRQQLLDGLEDVRLSHLRGPAGWPVLALMAEEARRLAMLLSLALVLAVRAARRQVGREVRVRGGFPAGGRLARR